MMQFINKRKYFYIFSGALVVASLYLIFFWGLKFGIDFTGGTQMKIGFGQEAPQKDQIDQSLSEFNLNSFSSQSVGNNSLILRYTDSDDETNEKVFDKVKELDADAQQLSVDFIGSTVSDQLKNNAIKAVILAIIGIGIYIALAFRKISWPVASWKYGLGAIIALAHDILITLGIFVVLGKYWNVEVGVPFIAALLTILGYSINDTIVVYDRTRENLLRSNRKEDFESIVNRSINETLARSLNTGLSVIFVLISIVLFGGEAIRHFSLALLIGVVFGTYSSIYVASALLVSISKWQTKSRNA